MRAWAIKLGTAGICVPFCEKHGIIGVGWRSVDGAVLASSDRDGLHKHIAEACRWYGGDRQKIGQAVGQLYRFARVCAVGDFVLYYDPPKKHVQVARVTSGPLFRDFETQDAIDIWHYRKVDLVCSPIPIVEFYGGIKGSLLGPKSSFWEIHDAEAVELLSLGKDPHTERAGDPELQATYATLRNLLVRRVEALDAQDWEWLVVDYFKAQGAHVDERHVGGSRAVLDLEARFDHGELEDEVWRVQVKRHKAPVTWEQIEKDRDHAGEDEFTFCYVSVLGFTDDARRRANEERVQLREAGDFARFLLSGKLRPRLRERLKLPSWV
jgi:predicted Mrr-cat superfamily restriction endonuclease